MDPETEKNISSPPEGSHSLNQLNRNRSMKSKQLVRSQALRETHSPPRGLSPAALDDSTNPTLDCKSSVEIQITSNPTDMETLASECRTKHACANIAGGACVNCCPSRDLLSHNPRIACVCVRCEHCRGKRRDHGCPVKQDSGISCSEDCPDCTEEHAGGDVCKSTDVDPSEPPPKTRDRAKPHLTRTDSEGTSELSGAELITFIKNTLNKNPKDRMTLLRIEKDLHALVSDTGRFMMKFPIMSSYGRMLVHRCAALYQLSHNIEMPHKQAVIVSKNGTSGGRIPCTSFSEWCVVKFQPSSTTQPSKYEGQAKSILKRSCHSLDDGNNNNNNNNNSNNNNTKTLQQREREYDTLRHRIFGAEECPDGWSSGQVRLLTADSRNRLVKVQSLEGNNSVETGRSRAAVAKSHSFGGYGHAEPKRILSRQGDLACSSWRLSPSSSGYRTLSLHSTDCVTPEPAGGVSPEPRPMMWCISDINTVPRGAVLLHPQTGRPVTNADGSVMRWEPRLTLPTSLHTEGSEDKRRGRLEKQHSFMDNDTASYSECDYQSEEFECDYPQHCDTQVPTQQQPTKTPSVPNSPSKRSFESKDSTNEVPEPSTNHTPPYSPPTNHTPPFTAVPPTNQVASYGTTVNSSQTQVYEVAASNNRPPSNEVTPTQTTHHQPQQQPARITNKCQLSDNSATYCHYPDYTGYRPPDDLSASQPALALYGQTEHRTNTTPGAMDHTMRQMPSGMLCHQIPQGYAYPNACRMDQAQYPHMYQPLGPHEEAHKQPHTEPTFRIDPSYPYNAIEPYATCPPACIDHRSVGVLGAGGPVGSVGTEGAGLFPVLSNVLVPHYTLPQYQPLQWQTANLQPIITPTIPSNCATPVQKPTSPPSVYMTQDMPVYPYQSQVYPVIQYPYHYPQIIQQPYYPVYQHGVTECQTRPDKTNTCRNTPLDGVTNNQTQDIKVPYTYNSSKKYVKTHNFNTNNKFNRYESNARTEAEISRQNSNELAMKIQQIKEQMAAMSTEKNEKGKSERKDEGKRRNNGNGILGSYPVNNAFNPARVVNNVGNDRTPRPPGRHDTTRLDRPPRIPQPERRPEHHNHNNSNRIVIPDHHNKHGQHTNYSQHYNNNNNQPGGGRHRPKDERREDDGDRRGVHGYRPAYLLRQMAPGTWCRRSPAPLNPAFNTPRRPPPDNRHQRR